MKYCVYVHKDLEGNVFYVGQGTLTRAKRVSSSVYTDSSKSKEYLLKIKELNYNFCSEILFSGLNKESSELLEKEVYDAMSLKFILTNKHRPASVKEMDFNYFDDILYYDPLSPSFLRWKVDRKTGKNHNTYLVRKGCVAGTLNSNGYYIININKKLFLAHRIVYLLQHKSIDSSMVIDHIDQNRQNNNANNLRMVTQRTNTLNSKIRADNSTGFCGISYCKKRDRYKAYITAENNKQINKVFSCRLYGKEDALKMAIAARAKMYAEFHK